MTARPLPTFTRGEVVPHFTTTYVRRANAQDGSSRNPHRAARAMNAGRHHPRSSWQRELRPQVHVY